MNKVGMWGSLLLLIIPLWTSAQSTISAGAAAAYGTDIDQVGVNVRAYLNSSNHRICFGPELTYFPTVTERGDHATEERELLEFNFNGHFLFELVENLAFYPLTGLNFSREREEVFEDDVLEESKTLTEWGWNVGAGLHYQLNSRWILFAEYDYLISELSQHTLSTGVLMTFGKGFKMGGHE